MSEGVVNPTEEGDYFCNTVLALNAGSSSLKFGLYWTVEDYWIERGQISGLGHEAKFTSDTQSPAPKLPSKASLTDALDALFDWLEKLRQMPEIDVVGHRFVHGGTRFVDSVIVDDSVAAELESLSWLAPLHMPSALSVLRRTRQVMRSIPSIACFDTAFHASLPDVEARMPIPLALHESGFRRYGFHGLSYEFVVNELAEYMPHLKASFPRRIVAAHLGSGSSLCAIFDGKSIATTMGFSTLDGLPMATRTGSIDPGAVIALQRTAGMSLEQLENLHYHEGGLLALSGFTGDMRMLLDSDRPAAKAAVDYYCYWAARHVASLTCALGGLDALVFTGGIGENASAIRSKIIGHLDWLGLVCAEEANTTHALRISPSQAKVPIYVLRAGEDRSMVNHVGDALHRWRVNFFAKLDASSPSPGAATS